MPRACTDEVKTVLSFLLRPLKSAIAVWQAGVLLYFRRMKEGMLQGRVALQGIEVLELALNLIGVSISGAASIVTFQFLSL